MEQKSYLLPGSILLAAIVVAGALVYNTGTKSGTPSDNNNEPQGSSLSVDEIKTALAEAAKSRIYLGDPKAPVHFVEFGDFQCPFCGKFHKEAFSDLKKDYIATGKVKMTYIDLAFLGEESIKSAEAAQCAGDQGQYWKYYDFIYSYLWDNYYTQNKNGENAGVLAADHLKKFAKDLGLDAAKFNECFDSRKFKSKVEESQTVAQKVLGDQISTPTSFVNGRIISGALPYAQLKKLIDEELAK